MVLERVAKSHFTFSSLGLLVSSALFSTLDTRRKGARFGLVSCRRQNFNAGKSAARRGESGSLTVNLLWSAELVKSDSLVRLSLVRAGQNWVGSFWHVDDVVLRPHREAHRVEVVKAAFHQQILPERVHGCSLLLDAWPDFSRLYFGELKHSLLPTVLGVAGVNQASSSGKVARACIVALLKFWRVWVMVWAAALVCCIAGDKFVGSAHAQNVV
jgi:hypothetical protein